MDSFGNHADVHKIGAGRGPSAWSIVGSMTRTVEQLQLSVEDAEGGGDYGKNEFLIRRMKFLRRTKKLDRDRRTTSCLLVSISHGQIL
jgi:hypothetical protein